MLKDTLKEYFYGFKEDQIDVGLISGNIELKDILIKPAPINKLLESQNLPIRLKAGMIARINVKVSPTKSMFK